MAPAKKLLCLSQRIKTILLSHCISVSPFLARSSQCGQNVLKWEKMLHLEVRLKYESKSLPDITL